MKIQINERKEGSGTSSKAEHIGYFKGTLVAINPDALQIQKIYDLDATPIEDPKYKITTKDDKELPYLSFLFRDEVTKIVVPYNIFIDKELAEFEKDGITKNWYVNQWGQTQCVADKKDLFRSFTHMQTYDKDAKVWEDILEDGKAVELQWRKCWKGETAIYSLLRKLVNQDWFKADKDTNLFVAIDPLLRGKVTELSTWINSDNYQSVVGMIEVRSEDKDGTTYYNQNCVDGAWMPGYRYAEANIITKTGQWSKYEDKASSKGKGQRDFYEFYNAVKRCKNTVDWASIHPFDPESQLATSTRTIDHAESDEIDMDYDKENGLR